MSSFCEWVFRQSSNFIKKINRIWFAWFKAGFWILCFAVAIDWGVTNMHVKLLEDLQTYFVFSCWCFWMSATLHQSWERRTHFILSSSGSSQQSAGCISCGLFEKDLQVIRNPQICRQRLASLLWVTLVAWKLCLLCFWDGYCCCCLPAVEGSSKWVNWLSGRGEVNPCVKLGYRSWNPKTGLHLYIKVDYSSAMY